LQSDPQPAAHTKVSGARTSALGRSLPCTCRWGEHRDTIAKRLFGHGGCYVRPRLGAAGTAAVVVDVKEGDEESVFLEGPEFGVLLWVGRHVWC
jgi:hypothetical protein